MKQQRTIAIVGAGLSGLSAALHLEKRGFTPLLIEAADKVGGRVATIRKDGFLLDAGFQILLSSYPMVRALDLLHPLHLSSFHKGAMIRVNQEWRPIGGLGNISGNAPYLKDFFLLARLVYSDPGELSIDELLQSVGFSSPFKHAFLEPFLRGVFIDPVLETRASRFTQLMRLFIKGSACLPKDGMGMLPLTLAKRLNRSRILYGRRVIQIQSRKLHFESHDPIAYDSLILATDQRTAAGLLSLPPQRSCPLTSFFFTTTDEDITPTNYLYLNDRGLINQLAFPDKVQPSYAPKGHHLASVTVLGNAMQQRKEVQQELSKLFPSTRPGDWELLRQELIPHALPSQARPPSQKRVYSEEEEIILAGETTDLPSINDALLSGKLAAEEVFRRCRTR